MTVLPTTLTRVTIAGRRKNVELLLPADQPVAMLLPRVTELLGEPPSASDGTKRNVLNRLGGPALPERSTLSDEGILDGAWLQLTTAEDALPEPIVFDVSDVVEDELPALERAPLLRPPDLLHAIVGAASLALAHGILLNWQPQLLTPATIVGTSIALLAAAILGSAHRAKSLSLLGLGAFIVVWYMWRSGTSGWQALTITAITVAGLQLAHEVGRRCPRGAACSLLSAGIASASWLVATRFTSGTASAAMCVGALDILLVGLAPRLALSLAGLNALDDSRTSGEAVRRRSVVESLRTAHRNITGSLLWFAGSACVAAVLVARRPETTWPWDSAMMILWGIVLVLRARYLPLATQRGVLVFAGLGALVSATTILADETTTAALLGLLAGLLLLSGLLWLTASWIKLPEHVAARGRILADRLESVAAIAIVPLLLGHFGIYSALTHTFQQ